MKKLYLLALAALMMLAPVGLRAQSFDGGFIAGPVTSQINGDGYGGFHQLGFTTGVFARIPTGGPSSWQLEVKYSLFGAHSSVDEENFGMSPMNIRLHYVEIPLMFRYDLSVFDINGKSLDFITLELGLSNDFLARGLQSADHEDGFDNASWLFYSITGNLGVQFDLNEHVGINIRSMNSITPCRFHPEAPVFSWYHYYNIALQATVVYTILHY